MTLESALQSMFWPAGNRLHKPIDRPVPFGRCRAWFPESPAAAVVLSQLLCFSVVFLLFIPDFSFTIAREPVSVQLIAIVDQETASEPAELGHSKLAPIDEPVEPSPILTALPPAGSLDDAPIAESDGPAKPDDAGAELRPGVRRTFNYRANTAATYHSIQRAWNIEVAWLAPDGRWKVWTGSGWKALRDEPKRDTIFEPGIWCYVCDSDALAKSGGHEPPSGRRAHYPDDRFWRRVAEQERDLPYETKSQTYVITVDDVKLKSSR